MILYTFLAKNTIKVKIILSSLYLMVMAFQLVHNALVIFSENNNLFQSITGRAVGILFALVPFVINRIFSENKNFYLPSVQDATVLTFNEIIENINKVKEIIEKGRESFSKENVAELLKDIPRHDSFRYINKESLTKEYFDLAYQTLTDQNIYIVISNTGSPASEIISMFTKKQYNHASISFDKELKTIVSYNGGEKIYPPGLNMEMIRYFNRKQDSSIIVYSIPTTVEKKKKIIDKIHEINRQGNAYNLFGLVFKFSYKPNIMFCSQFVYKMLKDVELNYFEKKDGQIKPTDLIELDYYRKLKYEYQIKFNELQSTPNVA
jgi:phosphopantetheinyl transferase (holo-ACP synthase)